MSGDARRHRPHRLALIFLLLAGCATPRAALLPALPDWATRQQVLAGVDEWEFAGRVGVSAGEEGFNGKIWWRQDGIVFRARLSGPLGVGTVFINGHGNILSVTDKDGEVTQLDDAERELRDRYGWTIPVRSLRYWALGIPDPGSDAQTRVDDDGRLVELQQNRWSVDIDRYAEGGGQSMPRRLTAISDDVRVRLIIDDWTFR